MEINNYLIDFADCYCEFDKEKGVIRYTKQALDEFIQDLKDDDVPQCEIDEMLSEIASFETEREEVFLEIEEFEYNGGIDFWERGEYLEYVVYKFEEVA